MLQNGKEKLWIGDTFSDKTHEVRLGSWEASFKAMFVGEGGGVF